MRAASNSAASACQRGRSSLAHCAIQLSTVWRMRVRISRAAFSVNVIAAMARIGTPCSNNRT